QWPREDGRGRLEGVLEHDAERTTVGVFQFDAPLRRPGSTRARGDRCAGRDGADAHEVTVDISNPTHFDLAPDQGWWLLPEVGEVRPRRREDEDAEGSMDVSTRRRGDDAQRGRGAGAQKASRWEDASSHT